MLSSTNLNYFIMGIFTYEKSVITEDEFRDFVNQLWIDYRFSQEKRKELEEWFLTDLRESDKKEKGISLEEVKERMEWAKKYENKKSHGFNDQELGIIENLLLEKLKQR